jgi:glycine dehydrogenase subunit 2
MTEPIIYELSVPGRQGVTLPAPGVPLAELPDAALLRDDLPLPQVSEVDVVRHYVRLSQLNYGVDSGMYPLGSCTMKYNPKMNEDAARLTGFSQVHPYQPEETVQGSLELMFRLQEALQGISGFGAVSLQPAAGAHGELTGVLMIRAYHHARGDTGRNIVLIPDSAHGTNPATTSMSGLEMVQLKSDERGNVDLDDLRAHLSDRLAGMMLTNPNTLGLFDEHLLEIGALVHGAGGLMYGDGANLNALMGIAKPAALGFDVMHINLHKTFSTPHGGGGPGSGPVGANETLAAFLPGPVVAHDAEHEIYHLTMPAQSIGRVKAFYGHFGVMVRAYAYIRSLGAAGLLQASEIAVLNANYLQSLLKDVLPLTHDRTCMHEFVLRGQVEGAPDVHALDIAKRLIDYGVHPPTNYFPLIVPEALMIEPTETESKRSLDHFAAALTEIVAEARRDPELLHSAPHTAPVRRLDEVRAARQLKLRWRPESQD